jgi:hypothetical protein
MIQDIHPHVFSNKFIETVICEEDYIFQFSNNTLLLRQPGEEFEIPLRKEFKTSDEGIFLFFLNNTNCFLVNDLALPDDPVYAYYEANLPPHPPAISIAGEMIEKFKKGILY